MKGRPYVFVNTSFEWTLVSQGKKNSSLGNYVLDFKELDFKVSP
jgi:hypothetical protein